MYIRCSILWSTSIHHSAALNVWMCALCSVHCAFFIVTAIIKNVVILILRKRFIHSLFMNHVRCLCFIHLVLYFSIFFFIQCTCYLSDIYGELTMYYENVDGPNTQCSFDWYAIINIPIFTNNSFYFIIH